MVLARRLLIAGGGSSFVLPGIYPPTDDSWTRSPDNPILEATDTWEDDWVQEPSVLVIGSEFVMYYSGGSTGAAYAMGRATCSLTDDPGDPANWTKDAGNPLLGQGGSGYAGVAGRSHVFEDGATYHVYFSDNTDLMHSTSADGITWATPTQVIAGATSGATAMTNSFVWREAPTDWRMLVEPVGGTWPDRIGYATSSDGLAWTFQNGGGPLLDLLITSGTSGGPWVIQEGATYHLWYHAGPDLITGLPTRLYHSTSTDLLSWTTPTLILDVTGSGFEIDQVADPSLVVVAGTAYLFYTGSVSGSTGPFKIGVATAPAVP